LRSSVFAWSNLRAAFRWSNTRAAFVGSLADRERAETLELYHRVDALFRRSRYVGDEAALDFTDEVVAEGCRIAGILPRGPLLGALGELVWQLLHGEPVFFGMPDREALNTPSLEGEITLRQFLRKKETILSNPDHYERIWRDKIAILIAGFLGELPSGAFSHTEADDNFAFSVVLSDLCGHTAGIAERIMGTMYDEDITHAGLFDGVRAQFEHNMAAIMGMTPERAIQSGKRAPLPTEMTGTHRRDIVHLFLGRTPFAALFETPLPLTVPQSLRFEHTHILAGSGHGKTQTLQHLILNDLRQPDPPSMVIIDSQGDMLSKISHLAIFNDALRDRLIIIDPRDVEHPPALNMFDVNLERISRYGAADREQILNGVVELYEYFFGSLLGAELTQKQSLVFRYLARLMIQIPSANLRTMIELMDDLSPYKSVIEKLPESSRMFFEKEFTDRQFGETRTQVKRRLYGIIENQTFERMFSSPKNRIDLPTALNEGKIVLVNTAKDFLKSNSSILGRYFIALTLQAALERAAIPERSRRPAFLYIDEASEYFDTNIDNLLIQARKYKLGIVVAHQYLDQLQGGLRASFAANTSIKLGGGVSDRDAHSVAPDMRTTPSFILEQSRGARETHFACYLRNVTPNAISISMPIGVMENEPQMSPAAYEELLERNRARISIPLMLAAPAEEPSPMEEMTELAPEEPAQSPAPASGSGPRNRRQKNRAATDASPEW
jgi:hypothetical protein